MKDRERWLKQRQTGIGSSDAPVILGLTKRKNAYELQQEKLGEAVPEQVKKVMRAGLAFEPAIITLYEEETGLKVRRGGGLRRSKKHSFMTWTPDGIVMDEANKRLVEAKFTFFPEKGEWGESGTDQIPPAFIIQTQHALSVMEHEGIEIVDVPVLMFGYIRIYTVKRHEALIKVIEEKEKEFWERHILAKEPVPIDFADPRIQDMILKRPAAENKVITLEDQYYSALAASYLEYEHIRKNAESCAKRAKAELVDAMADAREAVLNDGYRIIRTSYERSGYEVKATMVNKTTIKKEESL